MLYTLYRDIVKSDFDARAFRYLVITSQYRNPLNFNEETFPAAKNSLKRIEKVFNRLKELITRTREKKQSEETVLQPSGEMKEKIEKYQEEMELFLCDDLNTPRAIASYFQMISIIEKYLNQFSEETPDEIATLVYFLQTLEKIDTIFGFLPLQGKSSHSDDCNCGAEQVEGGSGSIPNAVVSLAQERFQLKKEKKFADSDVLRQKILELGYVVKDKKDGFDLVKKE